MSALLRFRIVLAVSALASGCDKPDAETTTGTTPKIITGSMLSNDDPESMDLKWSISNIPLREDLDDRDRMFPPIKEYIRLVSPQSLSFFNPGHQRHAVIVYRVMSQEMRDDIVKQCELIKKEKNVERKVVIRFYENREYDSSDDRLIEKRDIE